jgi:hypothetical protein
MDEEKTRYRNNFFISSGVGIVAGVVASSICESAEFNNTLTAAVSTIAAYKADYSSFLTLYFMQEKENYRKTDGKLDMKSFFRDKLPLVGKLMVYDTLLSMGLRGGMDKILLDEGVEAKEASMISDAVTDFLVYTLSALDDKFMDTTHKIIEVLSDGITTCSFSYRDTSKSYLYIQLKPVIIRQNYDTGSNYVSPSREFMGPWYTRQKRPNVK